MIMYLMVYFDRKFDANFKDKPRRLWFVITLETQGSIAMAVTECDSAGTVVKKS